MTETIQIALADKVLLAAYFVILIAIGLSSRQRKHSSTESYLLAGRRLSIPAFTATLVATWYGGILGIGEFTYSMGILSWFTQSLPYYIFAILFALLIAPRIQRSRQYTIPDLLYNRQGKRSGLLGSLLIFILVTPAPYLLMGALLLATIAGIPFWWSFLIIAIFSSVYILIGGFTSVVRTDIFQFFLMFFGFALLVAVAFSRYGGYQFLLHSLPPQHLTPTAGKGVQYLVVWFFIAMWTFVDPGFYQRCYAAKSPSVARKAILLSVAFWIVFDFLTLTAGLYSRALLPNINPLLSFPKIGEFLLPPLLRGFFFAGLLATIMSTLDSTAFLSATTFGRDLVWRLRKRSDINRHTRTGLYLAILLSAILIYLLPSVVKLWFLLGTLIIPSLLLPVLSALLGKRTLPDRFIFWIMLLTFLITSFWYLSGILNGSLQDPVFPLQIQPFFIGLGIAVILFLLVYGWQALRSSSSSLPDDAQSS